MICPTIPSQVPQQHIYSFFPSNFQFLFELRSIASDQASYCRFPGFAFLSVSRFVFEITSPIIAVFLEDPVKRHGDGGPASVSDCRFDRRVEERGHSAAPELDPEALHDRARARRGPHAEGAESVPQREQ